MTNKENIDPFFSFLVVIFFIVLIFIVGNTCDDKFHETKKIELNTNIAVLEKTNAVFLNKTNIVTKKPTKDDEDDDIAIFIINSLLSGQ